MLIVCVCVGGGGGGGGGRRSNYVNPVPCGKWLLSLQQIEYSTAATIGFRFYISFKLCKQIFVCLFVCVCVCVCVRARVCVCTCVRA